MGMVSRNISVESLVDEFNVRECAQDQVNGTTTREQPGHRRAQQRFIACLSLSPLDFGIAVQPARLHCWFRFPAAVRHFGVHSGAICNSWVGRVIPIRPVTEGTAFLVREGGRWMATPLLVALLVIEVTDLVFVLDSIPAVFAVTRDPFLVYSSNVFALLGFRSLYFVLAGAIRELRYLRTGLGFLLLFVAAKMLVAGHIEVSPAVSLTVIASIVGIAIVVSRLFPAPTQPSRERAMVTGTHFNQIHSLKPATHVCNECVQMGDSWVHLRMCESCGNVGCCDSSKNKHATAHYHSTGHPVMRSIEPGEHWKRCFVDEVMLD